MNSIFQLSENNRGLSKYDYISLRIGHTTKLLGLSDQQIKVKDLVVVSREAGEMEMLIGWECWGLGKYI